MTSAVSISPRDGGGFGIAVKMTKICPYSHATRNNVDVQFTVIGG